MYPAWSAGLPGQTEGKAADWYEPSGKLKSQEAGNHAQRIYGTVHGFRRRVRTAVRPGWTDSDKSLEENRLGDYSPTEGRTGVGS